jgi:hypothetical protein
MPEVRFWKVVRRSSLVTRRKGSIVSSAYFRRRVSLPLGTPGHSCLRRGSLRRVGVGTCCELVASGRLGPFLRVSPGAGETNRWGIEPGSAPAPWRARTGNGLRRSAVDPVIDGGVRGRDRDRAVQWSASLERLDQVPCLLAGHALEDEREPGAVEYGRLAGRGRVAGRFHLGADWAERPAF